MKATGRHRIASTVVIGVLFGWYIHHDYLRWHARGKEAFLAFSADTFKRNMDYPKPLAATVAATLIIAALVFGVYELLAALFSKLSPATESTVQSSSVAKPTPQPFG